jgi:hypothetical protein
MQQTLLYCIKRFRNIKMTKMKKIPITLIIRMATEVPEEWDDGMIKFHIEENHCIDNHIDQLVQENATHPGECVNCARGNAIVGHHFLSQEVSSGLTGRTKETK